ncbi:MAG TPA: tetratricopeptide repeat protein [Anaeromyxobacteraceae bacterium]|nr:tetratricopeptide repeat protein [Anaeromyxobacteraceae bacterium]
MSTRVTTAVAAAALGALGCATGAPAWQKDVEALRAEMRALQRDNAEVARRLEALTVRLDALAAARKPAPAPAAAPATAAPAALVPPDLAVVKVAPPAQRSPRRAHKAPPPLPTAVPIAEPDPAAVARLSAQRGDLAAEAKAALEAARRQEGLAGARALEEFTVRYPHHPSADNALLDAARGRDAAGDPETACALANRLTQEYPAGDALPDALALVVECLARQGDAARARPLVERLVKDFPDTPAAKRAQARLAAMPQAGAPASAERR